MQGSITDRLGLPPGVEDVELEIPPMRDLARSTDFEPTGMPLLNPWTEP
jgi:hypothetical protein